MNQDQRQFVALAAKNDIPLESVRPGTFLEAISMRAVGPGWIIHRYKSNGLWHLYGRNGWCVGTYRDLEDLFAAHGRMLSPFCA